MDWTKYRHASTRAHLQYVMAVFLVKSGLDVGLALVLLARLQQNSLTSGMVDFSHNFFSFQKMLTVSRILRDLTTYVECTALALGDCQMTFPLSFTLFSRAASRGALIVFIHRSSGGESSPGPRRRPGGR